MIRDRLKQAAKRAGIRMFGMKEQAAHRDPTKTRLRGSGEVDPDVIPKIVDGSGDTPGPNSKTDIGRTWVSAQVISGEGIATIDVRSPAEWAQGHVPRAILLPPEALEAHLDLIPGRNTDTYVVVYDATGGDEAERVAALLREHGWARARRLVGGFAEWVEEGEEVARPQPVEGARLQVGATVRAGDDLSGTVWRVVRSEGTVRYDVLVEGGSVSRSQEELDE